VSDTSPDDDGAVNGGERTGLDEAVGGDPGEGALSEAGSEEQPAVAVRDLRKVYEGGVLAVDWISFEVDHGEFCVVIGPSGCGKSTTLHAIVGKVDPTDGRVAIDGEDVTNAPTYERDIGLVFQDFQLFPHLTVEENVRYGVDRTGATVVDNEVVDETIELMRLGAVRERYPGDLSAGQKQRVAFARSLVLRPAVLLLDEPLGDMDYKLQKRMERELLRLHREVDTTFVYVTHDQRQAMRLGDKLVVMNEGRIEQTGSVDAVYDRPETAFVAAFVGDSNILSGEVVAAGDGQATLDTRFGRFTADASTVSNLGSLVGRSASFVVRPHDLALGAGGENEVTGDVDDVVGRPGGGTQVFVALDDGGSTEFQATSWEPVHVAADDATTLSWATADAVLLERTSVVEGADLETDILGE